MLFAVVPVKGLAVGKSRLAGTLKSGDRARLNAVLFQRVLESAFGCREIANVIVVSPDDDALARAVSAGAMALRETGVGGLNGALEEARDLALAGGAGSLLVLPSDLPQAGPGDLRRLFAALPRDSGIAIAPDAQGDGTNALLLRPAGAIPFCFGPGSFRRHVAAARAARLPCRVVRRRALAFDVDEPADLARLDANMRCAS